MANLSNINGKFVVEQTTGFVGIGTTDPEYLLHVNSSDVTNGTRLIIENTNGSGKKYGLISDNTGVFTVRDVTAGADRFSISNLGDATFTGDVTISQPTNASDAILNLTSKSGAGNSRTSSIKYDADVEKILFINEGATIAAMTSDIKVGIGIDSPDAKFHVDSGQAHGEIKLTTSTLAGYDATLSLIAGNSTGASVLNLGYDGDDDYSRIFRDSSGNLKFSNNNDTKLTIDSSGNVGIGVAADTSVRTFIKGSDSGTNNFQILTRNSSDENVLAVRNDGNVGIGTTSPDEQFTVGGSGTQGRIGLNTTGVDHPYIQMTQFGSPNTNVVVRIDAGGNSYFNGGNVGIGTTSPNNGKFVINQNSSAASFGGNVCQLFENFNTTDGQMMSIGFRNNNSIGTTAYIDAVAYDQSIGATDIRFSAYSGSAWNANMVTFQHTGRVGIGTDSPGGKLHIKGNGLTQNLIRLQHDGTGGNGFFDINVVSDKANLVANYSSTPIPMRFITGAAERMRITSGGNVLIGTTDLVSSYDAHAICRDSPSGYALIVKNSNTSTTNNTVMQLNRVETTATTGGYALIYRQGNASTGTNRWFVYANGNNVNTNNSYGAISDERLKENITDATPKLDDLMKVKVRNFNLKGEETKQIGVVAQELEEVFPGMIDESKTPDSEDETLYKGVKYSVFVPMLIKSIQELKADNDSLRARIETLENN